MNLIFFVDKDYVKEWIKVIEAYKNPAPSPKSPSVNFIPGLYMTFHVSADARRKRNIDIIDKELTLEKEDLLLWAHPPYHTMLNEKNIFEYGYKPESPSTKQCGMWQFNGSDSRFLGGGVPPNHWYWIDHNIAIQNDFNTFWEGDQSEYMV